MAAQASPLAQPGETVAGKYVVEHVLGAGAMGVLVAARHVQLGERVALKFLRAELAGRAEVVARFLREARAAARLKSEHVVRIVDLGTMRDGAPYMAMEFLEGCDLQQHLSKHGVLAVSEAVDFVIQACVAVSEAHAAGIVHRDLKPSNLFLTHRSDGSPLVKVLDFGISKIVAGADGSTDLTCSNAVLGSPVYMSPEQAKSARSVDARADVWSLGVILHHLVTGKPPFWGESITELLSAVLTDAPERLTHARPDAPPELEAVVLQCLEKDVARRIPDVARLAAALEPWAAPGARILIGRMGGNLAERPAPGPTGQRPASGGDVPVRTLDAWAHVQQTPARARVVAAVVTAAILAAFIAAAALWSGKRAGAPPATTASAPGAATRPPPEVASNAALGFAPGPVPTESESAGATGAPSVPLVPRGPAIASPKARHSASSAPPVLPAETLEQSAAKPTPPRPVAVTSASAPSNFRELFNDRR